MHTYHSAAIEIRQARPQDASAMNEILLERKYDIEPGYPDYSSERIAWYEANGIDVFTERINRSLEDPLHYFSRVAVVGQKVIGFAEAAAPDGDLYTWWRGLVISQGHEGIGMGRALEADRQAWARPIKRPVRGLIVTSNQRSKHFFLAQGFTVIGRQGPNATLPLVFDVVECDLE